MRQFIISENLINAIAGYLATKPYNEVAGLIRQIEANLKEFVPDEEKQSE
jgi:ribosomal protein S17E